MDDLALAQPAALAFMDGGWGCVDNDAILGKVGAGVSTEAGGWVLSIMRALRALQGYACYYKTERLFVLSTSV